VLSGGFGLLYQAAAPDLGGEVGRSLFRARSSRGGRAAGKGGEVIGQIGTAEAVGEKPEDERMGWTNEA